MNEEDRKLMELGEICKEFLGTRYCAEIFAFIDNQAALGKDAVMDLTISGEYEQAKAAGHKVAGLLSVKEFILGSISSMQEIKEIRKEERQSERKTFSHV